MYKLNFIEKNFYFWFWERRYIVHVFISYCHKFCIICSSLSENVFFKKVYVIKAGFLSLLTVGLLEVECIFCMCAVAYLIHETPQRDHKLSAQTNWILKPLFWELPNISSKSSLMWSSPWGGHISEVSYCYNFMNLNFEILCNCNAYWNVHVRLWCILKFGIMSYIYSYEHDLVGLKNKAPKIIWLISENVPFI